MTHCRIETVLIIGYGSIGKRHSQVLQDLYPDIQISIVSRHMEKADNVFHKLEDINDLSYYDYFVIASKTADHFDNLVLIDKSVTGKKILVEKPVFQIQDEYHSTVNHIFVGYNLRYHPVIQKVKLLLESKKILFVNAAVGQYLPGWRPGTDYRKSYSAKEKEGGGVLLDLSHEIDYLQWLCGNVTKVSGISCKVSSLEIDSNDLTTMIGVTANGIIFNLSMDYLSRKTRREVFFQCDDCTIHCDLINVRITITGDDGNQEIVSDLTPERNFTYTQMHVDIIEHNALYTCTMQEALDVMKTIKKIKESSREDWGGGK